MIATTLHLKAINEQALKHLEISHHFFFLILLPLLLFFSYVFFLLELFLIDRFVLPLSHNNMFRNGNFNFSFMWL